MRIRVYRVCVVLLLASPGFAADHYVSRDGVATWAQSTDVTTPCSLSVANASAAPGDTVYLRGGSYSGQAMQPASSGSDAKTPIVFTSYPGEDVQLSESYGIVLKNRSFIIVQGMSFRSMLKFFLIEGGHDNIIRRCTFDGRSASSGSWQGALIYRSSTHNWVNDCSFFRWAYGAYAEHRGGLLDIGDSAADSTDESSYNLIEGNTFAYGGHHTLAVYAPQNVIRNNYTHNETAPASWGFEGYRAGLTEGPLAGFNLYEGNHVGFAGASGLALRSGGNILRFNTFYRNGDGAIQIVANTAGVDHADHNRIYHNSFFHNGYAATYVNFRGGIYFSSWSGQTPVDNVIKNNIFYDNSDGSVRYDGKVDPQTIESNWDKSGVDPGFVDLAGADPANPLLPDLHLVAGSAAIDAAEPLTTITSATGSGTIFQVADAGYFMDGWGIAGVQGDVIQLAGTRQRARVINVDYAKNTLSVDATLSWTQGMGLSLAFEDRAPDLGAYEHAGARDAGHDGGGISDDGGRTSDGGGSTSDDGGMTLDGGGETLDGGGMTWDGGGGTKTGDAGRGTHGSGCSCGIAARGSADGATFLAALALAILAVGPGQRKRRRPCSSHMKMSASSQVEMSAFRDLVSRRSWADGEGAGHDEPQGNRSSGGRSAGT